jgi:hypothetical protein
MAIIATDTGGGGDFKPVPQGTHVAICNLVVDLGNQRGEYQGVPNIKRKVYVRWELPHERLEWEDRDGAKHEGPMQVGKQYTLSLHENANLRGDLEGWRGKAFTEEEARGFDITALAGKACMVSIVHSEKNGKTYANVKSISAMVKGMEKPEKCENGCLIYDEDNLGIYDLLPEWLRKKVDDQVRDEKAVGNGSHDDLNDDVPF